MTTPNVPAEEQLLISLAGVAELAGVRRPVASLWRTRSQRGDAPFPPAAAHRGGRDLFDAHAVAEWLVETGHGHNPDAVGDAAAYVDGMGIDFSEPGQVAELAALIALRAQTGEQLGEARDLQALAFAADPDDTHLRREVERHRERGAPWAAYADRLIDAAYSPAAALALVQRRAARRQRALGSSGALAAPARDLVTALVQALAAEVGEPGERPTMRIAPGVDTTLFDAVVRRFDGEVDVVWPTDDESRPLRRANACSGIPIDTVIAQPGAVVLGRVPAVAGASVDDIVSAVDELGLSLDPDEVAVMVGPARALVDGLSAPRAAARADTLRTGRVRAVVRLDAGHVTSASREALALWVFGPAADIPLGDRVIALADLTGAALSAAVAGDLVSDILANLGGPIAARAHAFRFARLQRTSSVLARSGALMADTPPRSAAVLAASRDLPTLLDAALAAAGVDAPALEVTVQTAALPAPETTTVDAAISAGHARVLAGIRLGADEIGDTGLVVVDAADLDDPAGIGARRVDHLAFAEKHPKAQLTRPGDVVFRTSPTPRAWVDRDGSHVVAYPARVLRVTAADPGGLVPELVAADITAGGAGPGAWRRWRVRTVAPAQLQPLRATLAAASLTRDNLRERIDRLDRLVAVLSDAVAARAVTISTDLTTQ
ncbi:hypothetical protein PU630_01695 [Microbacterium horticulturae]|uniref:Uncharacterized protein n=1 Tax=Microbacterium horticulturae TaxID=3028316 RepID=A0ABY8C0P6_9MICO|nr:hypothetical protein [Microbacterium sp. KACC 23027]WEG09302.1 hypothetical protein PU630_01695 [Microbacterium sp. KACC 23027]